MKPYKTFFICLFIFFTIPLLSAWVTPTLSKAPDAMTPGPHEVSAAEYRFPATIDQDILPQRKTEIWAIAFYPKNIKVIRNKIPLVIMLHGNHGTCGTGTNPRKDFNCNYTESGICQEGYIPVPNHEGYNYIAKNLASWGFMVVSINANRGITCGGGVPGDFGLNLARGRLVLKHLSLLYKWANEGGAPTSLGLGSDGLIGKLDFRSVGLFGHSRGGEGVRAAYNLYRDKDSQWPAKIPDLSIKAIFEVGAVDGQTSRVLDADGTVWNQLLPMCDGDVSTLEGRHPFERMILKSSEPITAQKSLYEVWGANHNYFNTEWQISDSYGCSAGNPIFDQNKSSSDEQQKIALASVPAFFRSHLGRSLDPKFNQNFNPLDTLPDSVVNITQVDRDFTPSPASSENIIVDDFDQKTGINTSGHLNLARQIDIEHKNLIYKRPQRVAKILWHNQGQGTYFEAIFTASSKGQDVHGFATLDFRIARMANELNTTPMTDFGIMLEEASGRFSNEVWVSDYAFINGPGNTNPVLKAVRIPLQAFKRINLANIHGVRLIFDKTKTGALYLANMRIQRQLGQGEIGTSPLFKSCLMSNHFAKTIKPLPPVYVSAQFNSIRSIKMLKSDTSPLRRVEIIVASKIPFPAMNTLPILTIDGKQFKLSRYSDPTHLQELTFTLTEDEYKKISKDREVTLSDGKIWQFGTLANALK